MNHQRLTHFDHEGRVHMVDVSQKQSTSREAVAEARVEMSSPTRDQIENHGFPKGDVLSIAELAGVMGAKQTSSLIPLCHPLPLTHVSVRCAWVESPDPSVSCLSIISITRTTGQTGVEMEALTACTTAALTVYDMCKAVDRAMVIRDVRLLKKSGGKSGRYEASP